MSKSLKQHVQTVFKMNGLQLRLDAASRVASLLEPLAKEDQTEWIDKILSQVEKQKLQTAVINLKILEQALSECVNNQTGDKSHELMNIISALDVPRLTFSAERKKYLKDDMLGRPPPRLLAPAGSKNTVYLDRFVMLHQRISRHDLFNNTSNVESKYKLKPVEFLLGTVNRLDNLIVLGMLTQITYGAYYLEDPTGVVKLDLTETKFNTGLFTENCFILAEGWFMDNIFHIKALGFPPAEKSSTTRGYFGSTNFFGGPHDLTVKVSEKLEVAEQQNSDATFVFLSDVWLDEPEVMIRLGRLFDGFSQMPPIAFVFCGNFLNNCFSGIAYNSSLKEHMGILGEMISKRKHLASTSQFLFVPGPTDPSSANIFPRPPLPRHITSELRQLVPTAKFLTNPARIQYCTNHIVVFREDIITKMCRNAIYFPEDGDIPTHFARTLTCQGHLAPLPLHTSPVYWDYDRSLYLYPLPDLVVTADKFEPFTAQNLDCQVINPGSFQRQDFSFKTYVPSTKTVEESQIPDDNDDMME